MFKSTVIKLQPVIFPTFSGVFKYLIPFKYGDDLSTIQDIPKEYLSMLGIMLSNVNKFEGFAYITIDEKEIKEGQTHRRAHPHIDGNHLPFNVAMGWGTGGWRFDNSLGKNDKETDTGFKLSYMNPNGGVLLASNYPSCRGWVGTFNGNPGRGGDVRHLTNDLSRNESFLLEANTIYLGNSQFVHESERLNKAFNRQLVRINLPHTYEFNRVELKQVINI